MPERIAAAEIWSDACKYPAGCRGLIFKYFIVMCHFNMLLYEHLNQSVQFSFPRGKSINNIILGRRVEVLITKSVSYGCRSCQEHKVQGCISAACKGECVALEPNARCINSLGWAEIRYYSQSEYVVIAACRKSQQCSGSLQSQGCLLSFVFCFFRVTVEKQDRMIILLTRVCCCLFSLGLEVCVGCVL